MSEQPECEYCGEDGTARFEGFSVCQECDTNLRRAERVRQALDDSSWFGQHGQDLDE